ncbi:hypothetical protein ACFWVC_04860 [Streptomyces sp. NPDC058691]|uniref:hypothetical protein n=1 Tax=Streptomyces sp. NPDC058691 TaxID=3346601 RepID=UPI00364EB84D
MPRPRPNTARASRHHAPDENAVLDVVLRAAAPAAICGPRDARFRWPDASVVR